MQERINKTKELVQNEEEKGVKKRETNEKKMYEKRKRKIKETSRIERKEEKSEKVKPMEKIK